MKRRGAIAAAAAALLLAACAGPQRVAAPGESIRTGRLALAVEDRPSQSFSAGFELRGRPEAGELSLFNPLGGTIAVLQWQPGRAVLDTQGRDKQSYPSLDAMVEHVTGAPLPVAALFDWLDGRATPVPGWEPDLTALAHGRVRARRSAPPPAADLRLVLDR
ncbi:outer membrane lipoprotein LolB [Ramlibacter algicola]|uniref:Outer-membrane lipoprotein LolB n=1 Tax=Ramlibacter algicola TaxID=2795217 RepID=A0A934PYA7_9BURK|nr:outer membrane lipoprotein LolB [Ramlibacter algicola]MBK0391815.1 outer membrane lipoprotein LolB [Ramlibacter algicola]